MTDTNQQLIDVFDSRVTRRNERREFFKNAIGALAVAGAGAAALTASGAAEAQTAPSDADILNFALNLEYLEAQFYNFAVNGTGLPASMLTGTGTQGSVTGGRQVVFTDVSVAQYAREIAADEVAHVAFLRQQLGASAVAQPALDIGVTPTSAFSNAARAAGLIGAGAAFDVYANDDNFLLGAFIFEDVGVTAYKGAAPLITSKVFLEAAAGILSVEAYHAAIIRTTLYGRGIATPSLRTSADAISDARDSLDGTTAAQVPEDTITGKSAEDDQGISPTGSGATLASNIVPLNANGLAYSRTPGQVLNIVYLTKAAVTMGGFFPAGVNGTNIALRTSGAF